MIQKKSLGVFAPGLFCTYWEVIEVKRSSKSYFLNPFFFFIRFPTKFQAGIFFKVLLTG